ncbi:LacI family DNA-binding transcriptional regulator [Microbacterium awajiense]|uniref:LacI family DNA-binding transcriptional regulator n=1 Tax=Microbacterium awajiense TaxID=415214 RepID=A0ABP7AW14_9MICO
MRRSAPGEVAAAPTMQDLATSLGVSVSTVSLALRGHSVISEATRARVVTKAEQLGYVYNRAAANLRTQRRHLVGLVVPDVANPVVADIALGLQSSVASEGLFVVSTSTLESVDAQHAVLRALTEDRAAGIVLIPALETKRQDLAIPASAAVPLVILNRSIEGATAPYVGAADEKIVDLALAHLFDHHHPQTVAYFGGIASASPYLARRTRFEQIISGREVTHLEPWSRPTAPTAEAGYRAFRELLTQGPPPDAVVCHSDSIAIGVLKALNEVDASPSECAVVGIDGLATSAMTTPGLTTIAIGTDELGRGAGAILLDAIAGEPARADDLSPVTPTLVVRQSCGCIGDPLVVPAEAGGHSQ